MFSQRMEAPQLTAPWSVALGGLSGHGHRPPLTLPAPRPPRSNMWGSATPPPGNSLRVEFLVDVRLALERC